MTSKAKQIIAYSIAVASAIVTYVVVRTLVVDIFDLGSGLTIIAIIAAYVSALCAFAFVNMGVAKLLRVKELDL